MITTRAAVVAIHDANVAVEAILGQVKLFTLMTKSLAEIKDIACKYFAKADLRNCTAPEA